MRLQTMYLVNIQVKKADRIWNATKFMPFEWDEKTGDKEIFIPTEEEWKEREEKFKNIG